MLMNVNIAFLPFITKNESILLLLLLLLLTAVTLQQH